VSVIVRLLLTTAGCSHAPSAPWPSTICPSDAARWPPAGSWPCRRPLQTWQEASP